MIVRDRFGTPAKPAAVATHLGRWWIDHGDEHPPTPLLPDRDGAWSFVEPSGASCKGHMFGNPWPGEPTETALIALGQQLAEQSPSWGTLVEYSPLAPNLDRWVERQPLEDQIDREIQHLEQVCRAPQTHIELHTERVALGRARKLDRRAPQWLATHSEDWAARRVFGVMPRRLLALVREPRWDIYENRVAARLVDHLVEWLRRRVATLRQICDEVLSALDQETPEGTHQRQARLYELWGEAFSGDQLGAATRGALRDAERWLHRLLALMDSPLYRNVPRQAHVETGLRTTNLFMNDPHYRGVLRLWQAWAKSGLVERGSMRGWEARAGAIMRGFESWCTLLVVRACSQLGLGPVAISDATPLRPGASLTLIGGFELHLTEHGNLYLRDHQQIQLELIPLLQTLECPDNPTATRSRVAPLIDANASCEHWRIVLHLGTSTDSPIASVGNPPHPDACAGAIDFIRVSPFALDSVERIARAIRWVTCAPRMLAYPPSLSRVPTELGCLPSGELTSRLTPQQRQELEQKLEHARRALDEVRGQREQIADELRSSRGDRRRMSELNQLKSRNNAELDGHERRVSELDDYGKSVDRAEDRLRELCACPVCHELGVLEARQRGCFFATCVSESCGATWELRRNDSGDRIPVLMLESARVFDWPSCPSPHLVDRWVGSDILALPARLNAGELSFIAPRREPYDSPARRAVR